jgi:DNA/RNA-binding domain of Phe-tRNA-synthetase-like protein
MRYRLMVDPQIFEQYPDYQALILYAEGLVNGPSDAESVDLLRSAEKSCRASLTRDTITLQPHVAAWRHAYQRFGAKPKKYPCSLEALLSRTVKGQDLPAINRLVDLYNTLSLKYLLPVGGEDWARLESDLHLTFANGNEPFLVLQEGQEQVTYPEVGEVIWVDEGGVTCRRWNWRQGMRTRLTEATQDVYFVLDRLAPYPTETLWNAGEELKQRLQQWCPSCTVEAELLALS